MCTATLESTFQCQLLGMVVVGFSPVAPFSVDCQHLPCNLVHGSKAKLCQTLPLVTSSGESSTQPGTHPQQSPKQTKCFWQTILISVFLDKPFLVENSLLKAIDLQRGAGVLIIFAIDNIIKWTFCKFVIHTQSTLSSL